MLASPGGLGFKNSEYRPVVGYQWTSSSLNRDNLKKLHQCFAAKKFSKEYLKSFFSTDANSPWLLYHSCSISKFPRCMMPDLHMYLPT